jgi:hypothetical protein
VSETGEQTRKDRLKELASDLRSAVLLQEQAAVGRERAEVAYRHCTTRTEDLLRQLVKLDAEHDF